MVNGGLQCEVLSERHGKGQLGVGFVCIVVVGTVQHQGQRAATACKVVGRQCTVPVAHGHFGVLKLVYASPDGGYANNDKLSRNRTQALKDYLTSVYPIDQKLIKVAATAEDWEGTAEYIAHNDIPQKDIALSIINSSLQPDAKEKALKRKAPEAHRFLLQNVWPGLRRTDYTIEYDVKAFNLEEAKKVIKTRPQKLSLQEMYMVANSLPKGSNEYNNVFETAVKLFPEDKLANLNAAYIAIERGDKVSAEKYLKKVGDTPEANNARGCLAVQKEDYQAAKEYFEKAVKGGLKKAQENLDKVNKVLE